MPWKRGARGRDQGHEPLDELAALHQDVAGAVERRDCPHYTGHWRMETAEAKLSTLRIFPA
jgi:hypothetical protein